MPHHTPVSVVHVEDNPIWQDIVTKLVDRCADFRQVGRAATAAEGFALLQSLKPDLLLLDLSLPDGDGLALARKLRRQESRTKILAVSVRNDEATLCHLDHGVVAGLLWKDAGIADQLVAALHELCAGRRFIPTEVRSALSKLCSAPKAFTKMLSDWEIELLVCFGQGMEDDQIATAFELSPATVKTHRQRIMGKLNLHRTADLMCWAAQKGFCNLACPPPQWLRSK